MISRGLRRDAAVSPAQAVLVQGAAQRHCTKHDQLARRLWRRRLNERTVAGLALGAGAAVDDDVARTKLPHILASPRAVHADLCLEAVWDRGLSLRSPRPGRHRQSRCAAEEASDDEGGGRGHLVAGGVADCRAGGCRAVGRARWLKVAGGLVPPRYRAFRCAEQTIGRSSSSTLSIGSLHRHGCSRFAARGVSTARTITVSLYVHKSG